MAVTNSIIRVLAALGLVISVSACEVNNPPSLKAERRIALSEYYGICLFGLDQLQQSVGPRGTDSDTGTLHANAAKVSYEVGPGPQVDHARGKRTEYPALAHDGVIVYLWEDPDFSAFVVEGLRENKRPSQTPVEIWYSFEKSDGKSKALAESLAPATTNCQVSATKKST